MSKIIIGIHGLGNKPPQRQLEKWWLKAIVEGLIKMDQYKYCPKFELVYWADILNDKPLSSNIDNPENPYFLDEPYIPEIDTYVKKEENSSTKKKVLGFLEEQLDKIFLNKDLSPNLEFVSEIIFKKYFKELDIYYKDDKIINDPDYKTPKDIIRNRLARVLERHKDKQICLIAHSMGSIIAYDVLTFITPHIKIDTLITIGSPLGIPIIISKAVEEMKQKNLKIQLPSTPENVESNWFNLADIDDNVAMNYNLADDYHENSLGVKVTDIIVNNNYTVNNHKNPHKSYGYLRTPEFAKIISDFLLKNESDFSLWMKEKYDFIKNLFK